ncbi:MAG: pyruvate carboxylase [Alphaproteobacteria bacterium]|nr:MAG: pyruvate carboxylase [Alphaproteobacteria bacterium]
MTRFNTSSSALADLSASLNEGGSLPTEDALVQLGHALMTELIDVISDTALEDFQTILGEALIGAFHSAAGRIERDADRARDTMRSLDRDFDGSEAADVELQEATAKARAGDAATQACELIRDAASETWTVATGEVWTAWRGSRRGTHLTAAQLEAKQAIRAIKQRKSGEADPGGPVIAFRGAPTADSAEDAGRIFDALNWAKQEWPDMALATTGAKGSEKLAIKWAQQKGVKLILARADFDTHGKAAPFRANDELIALEPEVCLTLVHSLAGMREDHRPFGPALNLGQKAMESGLRHVPIKARAA